MANSNFDNVNPPVQNNSNLQGQSNANQGQNNATLQGQNNTNLSGGGEQRALNNNSLQGDTAQRGLNNNSGPVIPGDPNAVGYDQYNRQVNGPNPLAPPPVVILGGATIGSDEVQRVQDAMNLLARDNHAPREITVTATLHVHHEYPKHITIGKDKEDQPMTKLVYSADEEAGLFVTPANPQSNANLQGVAAQQPAKTDKGLPIAPADRTEKTWPKK